MSLSTCRYPGVTRLYPGPPGKAGLELSPTRNQTRPEWNQNSNQKPEQNQNSSSLPSKGDRPPTLSPGWGPSTGVLSPGEGDEKKKKVGQEGLRRGKREGRRERSVKSLVLYLVRVLWPVVHVSRRPGTKGFQLRQLGLVPSAGKLVRKYPEWSGCQSQWRVLGTLHWKKTDNGHGE